MKFALYATLLALQLVDYATTVYILKNGGRERNKFLLRVFTKIGVEGGILLTKAAIVIGLAWRYDAIWWWAFAALVAAYVYVMRGNLGAALRIRDRARS